MNKRILVLVVVLALVVLAGIASAEVKQGDREISFSGAWADLSGDDGHIKTTLLTGSVGYFVSDPVELSIKGTGAWIDVMGTKLDAYGIGGDVKYHWNTTGVTVPYIGAQWNYLLGKSSDSSLVDLDGSADGSYYGPLLGVKFFLNDTTILFVEYQYDLFTGDIRDVLNHANIICSGLSFKF
jgi:hypothetical protein